MRIAQVFNNNYDDNNDGPVWDRWDARSKALISRAEYIRRHAECATAPQGPAYVESVAPGPHGTWLVRYEISGQQLTDYWYYTRRRWEFDLPLSNPDAARLYPLPFAKYAVDAPAAVALEDGPSDLAGDGLTLVTRALPSAFLDVQQGMGALVGAVRAPPSLRLRKVSTVA